MSAELLNGVGLRRVGNEIAPSIVVVHAVEQVAVRVETVAVDLGTRDLSGVLAVLKS